MEFKQKKNSEFLLRVTPDLKHKICEKSKELNCSMTELITSMIEHCFAELDKKPNDGA